MFAAVLDTCVLWPSRQRDFLLSLAIAGLYRPLWSDAILEELEYHEAAKLEGRGSDAATAAAAAALLVGRMREAFDDAVVTGWEPLDGSYGLPDPDDEHVVAAAVVGGAGVIVTHNFKDFPEGLVPKHIQVVSPAEFAADTRRGVADGGAAGDRDDGRAPGEPSDECRGGPGPAGGSLQDGRCSGSAT
ncbi:PIN domain-containing protein [Rhodococcus sp. NPDC003318]|uniref:PIN domain-containing protein n=1 Tax=Rhodococcus sp. NPDC003318 TaxID=3364503 RepID=UPI0036AD2537